MVTDARPVPFRYTFYIGSDGKLLYIDKSVNAATHGADVVKKLKELGVAKKAKQDGVPKIEYINKTDFKFDANGNIKNNFKIYGENLHKLCPSKTVVKVKDKDCEAVWTIDTATNQFHSGGKWIQIKKPKIKKNKDRPGPTPGDITITVTSNYPILELEESIEYFD